jgi:hypothetical protein
VFLSNWLFSATPHALPIFVQPTESVGADRWRSSSRPELRGLSARLKRAAAFAGCPTPPPNRLRHAAAVRRRDDLSLPNTACRHRDFCPSACRHRKWWHAHHDKGLRQIASTSSSTAIASPDLGRLPSPTRHREA